MARRWREEVSISYPFLPRSERKRGRRLFGLKGEGEASRTQTPLMSCGRGGVAIPPFSVGGLETVYQKEKKMEQVKEEEGRGRIGRRRRGRCR